MSPPWNNEVSKIFCIIIFEHPVALIYIKYIIYNNIHLKDIITSGVTTQKAKLTKTNKVVNKHTKTRNKWKTPENISIEMLKNKNELEILKSLNNSICYILYKDTKP
jgi:hypothetical protein